MMSGRNSKTRHNTQELPGFARIYRERDRQELPKTRPTSPEEIALADFQSGLKTILNAFARIETSALRHESERGHDHAPYEEKLLGTMREKSNSANHDDIKALRAVAVLIRHKLRDEQTGLVDIYLAARKVMNAASALNHAQESNIEPDLTLIGLDSHQSAVAIDALLKELKSHRLGIPPAIPTQAETLLR